MKCAAFWAARPPGERKTAAGATNYQPRYSQRLPCPPSHCLHNESPPLPKLSAATKSTSNDIEFHPSYRWELKNAQNYTYWDRKQSVALEHDPDSDLFLQYCAENSRWIKTDFCSWLKKPMRVCYDVSKQGHFWTLIMSQNAPGRQRFSKTGRESGVAALPAKPNYKSVPRFWIPSEFWCWVEQPLGFFWNEIETD